MRRQKDVRSREAVVLLAEAQDGVVTRSQARDLGLSRFALQHEVRQGRFRIDRQAVRVVGAATAERAMWRRALANCCPDGALDGVTALVAHGLTGFTDDLIHLGIPRGGAARSRSGVRVHVLRSWDSTQVQIVDGLRVTNPNVAAVRAALWAHSDRAAAIVLAMAVQQQLAGGDGLSAAAAALPRNKRRRFIQLTVDEVLGGSESINEIDLIRICRGRGLPIPDRQTVLKRPSGRSYLDAEWADFGVSVEVDGTQHALPQRALADCVKTNASTLGGRCLLRMTTLGVRTQNPELFAQLEEALRLGGWRGSSSSPVS